MLRNYLLIFFASQLVAGQSQLSCPEASGNFPNPGDTTCRTYFQCSNFQPQSVLTCPSNFRFHPYPSMRRCLLPDSVDCNDPNPFVCPQPNANVADPKNCKRFYACQDSAPLHRTCPAGQIFDSKNQRCVTGDSQQCNNGGNGNTFQCPTSSGNYPDKSDPTCTNYFTCSNGQAVRIKCPSDYKFHPYSTVRRCLLPDSVDCNDPNPFVCATAYDNYADPKDCSRYYSCQDYAPLHRRCPSGQTFVDYLKRCETGYSSQCDQNSGVFQCPPENGMYADPSDKTCRNYYSCTNSVGYQEQCSDGYRFYPHPDMRKCVLEDSYDCNDPNPFTCPQANEDFPDPRNCSRFYFCDNKAPLHRTCPSGNIYDDTNKRCVPGNPSTCDPNPEPFVCPNSNGDFADLEDKTCRNFYRCNNGQANKELCPNDYQFHSHPNMRRCVLQGSFDCDSPNPFVCPASNADVPDPLNCNRFYSCQNYAPLHRTCPSGEIFVDSEKSCKQPNSQYQCVNFVCPQTDGKYEDPNDMTCRSYYECTAGEATRVLCQNDFKFQPYPTARKCMLADSVDCKPAKPFVCLNANDDVPDPNNSARFYSCQNYAPLHRTCAPGQTFRNELKRCQ